MADTLCISTALPTTARMRALSAALPDAMADVPYPPGCRTGVHPTQAFLDASIAHGELFLAELDGALAGCMVQYAIGTARSQGCRALRLDVLGGNVPAERLYTGQGFARRGTVRMFYADTGWTDYGLYEYLL